ncbi:hypothetical protein CONPUDRAFT_63918 [Coniophora puteana RWD-64-598 SS2]|uniref:Thioesterase domain-containing protein n=1 Tax=Coniophora puteana (strain RWD-64-598) TaxID=741705 RepID=A0A5M3MB02_CONPW|nr:uncharacterized protein CONPUDRAFT_63918 [Coniophora puteana RWD-64-598 SS2]EIW76237.1 hypothetical protein CONPUDRAFT_63918 [Coniophora puteana RWD-64-598 SS2]
MKGYEPRIADRPVLTEVSINPKAEEPKKDEGRVVYEVTVEEDMLNAGRILHGACIGQLIDNCSTMPIFLMGLAKNGVPEMGVSQAINISYHSPALLGEKLRIVSTTTVMNKQALSANCEVWNVTSNRLVASGTHTKMVASTPRNGEPAKL